MLGGFLLVTVNLDRAVSRWSAAAEFSIYLADDITPRAARDAQHAARGPPRRRVPRACLEGGRGRPLQARLPGPGGRPRRSAAEPAARIDRGPPRSRARPSGDALEAFARLVSAAEGVADVRFDRRWLERLGRIAAGVRWAGWILGAVLLVGGRPHGRHRRAPLPARAPRRGGHHAVDGRANRPAARAAGGGGDPAGRRGRDRVTGRALRRLRGGPGPRPRHPGPGLRCRGRRVSSRPACRRCSSSSAWSSGARADTSPPATCVDTRASRN
ncbi:MAG: hypothetical protein MZW92_53730 [Comamonadaceae bacterium]|nr:hypothetical protein [Comamonadaceae bacterium]